MVKTIKKIKKQELKAPPELRLLPKTKKIEPPKPIVRQKEEITEIEEELEEEFFNDDVQGIKDTRAPRSFNYPLLRRAAPGIRIQPITTNLEIDLDNLPNNRRTEEDKVDQYKATPEKNYSLNQKYEIPGSGPSYESIAPKAIKSPSPTLSTGFDDSMNAARGFGTQNQTAPGYPGQGNDDRKYDTGLVGQTQRDRRRRDM